MKCLFSIGVDDAQYVAQKRIGRKLTLGELERIKKGIEFGLELCWEEVLETAIDEATGSLT